MVSKVDLHWRSREKIIEFLNVVPTTRMSRGIWDRIQEHLLFQPFHSHLIVPGHDYFDGVFASVKRRTGVNCAANAAIAATDSDSAIYNSLLSDAG